MSARASLLYAVRRKLRLRRDDEVIVSEETYRRLRIIARSLDCNVRAAVDEVVREFTQ